MCNAEQVQRVAWPPFPLTALHRSPTHLALAVPQHGAVHLQALEAVRIHLRGVQRGALSAMNNCSLHGSQHYLQQLQLAATQVLASPAACACTATHIHSCLALRRLARQTAPPSPAHLACPVEGLGRLRVVDHLEERAPHAAQHPARLVVVRRQPAERIHGLLTPAQQRAEHSNSRCQDGNKVSKTPGPAPMPTSTAANQPLPTPLPAQPARHATPPVHAQQAVALAQRLQQRQRLRLAFWAAVAPWHARQRRHVS